MLSIQDWVQSFGISIEATAPTVKDYNKPCARSAKEIAVRTIILQGVVAVASAVDPQPIVEWFEAEELWDFVTSDEKAFLGDASPTQQQCNRFGWHQEAEWALLWAVGKVDSLGLPDHRCDSRQLCTEIIPALGSNIEEFIESAELRVPGALLAEDDRTYNLWCYVNTARTKGNLVPEDLDWNVLFERRYAFEWLGGIQEWDDVTCDS